VQTPARTRRETDISTRSSARPNATGFATFDLPLPLRRGIEAAGYDEPRPIQTETIPAVLAGRDVLGLAPTGTGKTAAFALPILARLLRGERRGPRALVLVPTRELATQIQGELQRLGHFTNLRSTTLFGGTSIPAQIRALRARPDVLIACPGRLLDLLGRRAVDLSAIEVLVLDEADHMFDMGFVPDVKRILAALPPRRQNLLFSATMPDAIRGMAEQILHRPHCVELAHSTPPPTIDLALYPVASEKKLSLLRHLIDGEGFTSAIVFLRTKRRAKRLADQLCRLGHRAVALQGNMSQPQRDRAMRGFRDGRFDVLVATDIAARGLDIANVSHVINFDVPTTPDAYTHRIGRTGRSERTGTACTMVSAEDNALVKAIEKRLGAPIERRSPSGFGTPSTPRRPAKGSGPRTEPGDAEGGTRRPWRPLEEPHGAAAAPGKRPGRRPRQRGPARRRVRA